MQFENSNCVSCVNSRKTLCIPLEPSKTLVFGNMTIIFVLFVVNELRLKMWERLKSVKSVWKFHHLAPKLFVAKEW